MNLSGTRSAYRRIVFFAKLVQVLAVFADNKFAGNFCKEGLSAGAGLLLLAGELID